MSRLVEDHIWFDSKHVCPCGTKMHRCQGSTFYKCFTCGAEGYEVPQE
jgi:hypothetical protein